MASERRLLHNHPSGDPTPSKADIEMAREVQKAAAALGVGLHDHVILARGRHTSLKSLGLI
jgi:DNA repair protein RadC